MKIKNLKELNTKRKIRNLKDVYFYNLASTGGKNKRALRSNSVNRINLLIDYRNNCNCSIRYIDGHRGFKYFKKLKFISLCKPINYLF